MTAINAALRADQTNSGDLVADRADAGLNKAAPLAFGRWAIAGLFVTAGIGKVTALGPTVALFQSLFAETWLPGFVVTAYAAAVGFIQIAIGALLVVGFRLNLVLCAALAVMFSLQFGQAVLQQWPTVSDNTIYLVVIGSLMFLSRFDTWTLDSVIRRRSQANNAPPH